MEHRIRHIANGISTFVRVEGNGSPLVMLHGMAATGDCWQYVIEVFRASYQVIVPDLPGHGRSTAKAIPYSLHFYVDWLDNLLEALFNTKSVTIIGNSLGGAVGAAYAMAHPERIDRLVMVDPLGFSDRLPWEAFSHAVKSLPLFAVAAIWRKTDPYMLRAISPWIFRDPWGPAYDAINRMASLNFTQGFWSVGAGIRLVLTDFASGRQRADFLDRLSTLALPMLIVWGRHDGMLPLKRAAAGLSRLPHASVKILEQSSHSGMLEQPGEFNEHLRQFLAQTQER